MFNRLCALLILAISVKLSAQEANPLVEKNNEHQATIKEIFLALAEKKTDGKVSQPLSLFKHHKKDDAELEAEETIQSHQSVTQPLYKTQDRFFYDNYLSKYYPKANVIRYKFFPLSKVDDLAHALRDVIDMLTYEPWVYVADSEEKCSLDLYWEFIIDQLAMLNTFLRQARVDLLGNIVYHSQCGGNPFGQHIEIDGRLEYRRTKNLFLYLKDSDNQLVGDFYALCFDYLVKMFNEGILCKDTKKVDRYFSELEYVLGKLRASPYEEQYHESLKTCKELSSLLENRMVDDKIADIDNYMIHNAQNGNGYPQAQHDEY